MRIKKNYHWLRHPRTTQEKRANQGKNNQLVRGKRKPRQLIDSYDDILPTTQKSWKVKRLKQYRIRGKKYCVTIRYGQKKNSSFRLNYKYFSMLRYISDFFCNNDTSYKIEHINTNIMQLYWWSNKNIGIDYLLNKLVSINKGQFNIFHL